MHFMCSVYVNKHFVAFCSLTIDYFLVAKYKLVSVFEFVVLSELFDLS